ncbi:MAG: sigma-54-dependent Fis family transcriptional regulator [Anaeromyxobacter sp.]|nr:sigma-54-dependent Fis family transcriptional regulator [Anaeromyxobacter sp.]MBL0276208.1 sigma-54-dependent Fis family transcriptional regulator [Anaeromyxobacter sp.]
MIPSIAALSPPRLFSLEPVAESPAMREALLAASDVAPTPTTVLLLGESGTGKEVLARYVHARSLRAAGPWVAVNCAALPAELLESELFGHERGAFTGAAERRAGRFEQASGGTLLLDEVSELPLTLQAKLLRVLQEREIDRVGGGKPVPVDVRIVATTNRDLLAMVQAGHFRSDLYYRLNVYPIQLPALRARREDVAPLSDRLLAEAAAEQGRTPPPLSEAARQALAQHRFPGNVRELRNLLERALVRCREGQIEPRHLGLGPATLSVAAAVASASEVAALVIEGGLPPHLPIDLGQLEKLAIEEALRRVNGNRTHAARLLGIGLRTLRNKLKAWREAGLLLAPLDPAEAAEAADRPYPPGPFALDDGAAAMALAHQPARPSQGGHP